MEEAQFQFEELLGSLDSLGLQALDRWKHFLSTNRVWSEEMVRQVCRASTPEAALLVENAALSDELKRFAVRTLLAMLPDRKNPFALPNAAEALEKFAAAGFLSLSSEERDWLFRDAVVTPSRDHSLAAATALLRTADAQSSELAEIAESSVDPQLLRRLAAHPAAEPKTLRHILNKSWSAEVMEGMAQNPRVHEDADLYGALRLFGRLSSAASLKYLALSAAPTRFRELFADLTEASVTRAADVLEQASPAQRQALRQEDLLPLLSSERADIRLIAIRLSSERQTEPAPLAETRPDPGASRAGV